MWRHGSLPIQLPKKLLGEVCDGHTSSSLAHPSLITINTTINGKSIVAMVDTGATSSLISQSTLDNIAHPPIQSMRTTATLGDGQTKIMVNGTVKLNVTINHINTTIEPLIVDFLGANLILGMDWCKDNNVNVNIGENQVEINHPQHGTTTTPFLEGGSIDAYLTESFELLPHQEQVVKLHASISNATLASFVPDSKECAKLNIQIPEAFIEIKDFSFYICVYNASKTAHKIGSGRRLGAVYYQSNKETMYNIIELSQRTINDKEARLCSIMESEGESSREEQPLDKVLDDLVAHIDDKRSRQDFLNILRRNKRTFDTSTMTRASTQIQHTINTGDHPPTSVRPYYKTVKQRKEMQQEVGKLLDQGILRPSTSPWSSPVLLKEKPDGTYRFLVDFRRLNSITRKDSYPQPSAEELVHRLAGNRYFTKLDLRSGYFQIPIHDSDIPKTAIITQDGLYEFTVLAQGLMNAPPTFQRVMNELLANGRWDYVVVYLDDIVIFSKTIDEHKRHVAEVISTLHAAKFQVSPPKCSIAVEKIEFLGHIITSTRVEPTPDKIKAIIDIAPPTTLSQANKFIGKVGYYRKFIRDFAKTAAPLHKVTNKTRAKRHEFHWGDEQQMAFDKFKSILTAAPLFLDFPDPSAPFILSTDASDLRVAGVLKQKLNDELKICYYKSRLLSDTERRYSTTEREALAIYWCLTELRSYIGESQITVETDHKPLVNMHQKRNYGNKRIDNWLICLQDLIPQISEIRYQRGIDNAGPDYLTRYETVAEGNKPQSVSVITRSMTKQVCNKEKLPIKGQDPVVVESTTPLVSVSSIDLSWGKIKMEQENDPEVQRTITSIRAGKKMESFALHENTLFRLAATRDRETKSKIPWLPRSMINTVLRTFHDNPLSGHFGIQRTMNRIRRRFWWPEMRATIENYVLSCEKCKKFNILRSKVPGHLKSYDPPKEVFQILHMDFWGPVRASKHGNRYVLVLTDNLSKYVIAKAMPTNTAKDAAEFLMNEFIMVHGTPERLITDNGVHFNNTLLRNITDTMNISHAFSAVYHPETNGQVERFNSTFCTQLAKYYDEEKEDWDDYLMATIYAYNTSVHTATGYAPYELAFGRAQKSPFDPSGKDFKLAKPEEFYIHLRKVREILLTQARESILRQQQLVKQRYDKNRKDISYATGDLVYLKVCGNRTKLDQRWAGPYCVIVKKGKHSYLVEDRESGKTVWAHTNQLQLVVERRS